MSILIILTFFSINVITTLDYVTLKAAKKKRLEKRTSKPSQNVRDCLNFEISIFFEIPLQTKYKLEKII